MHEPVDNDNLDLFSASVNDVHRSARYGLVLKGPVHLQTEHYENSGLYAIPIFQSDSYRLGIESVSICMT